MRLYEVLGTFSLHPKVNSEDYQIGSSLRDVGKWKARIILANNTNSPPGEMDDIHYVMISLKDNTLIPIARGDEHHTGYDLIRHLGLNPSDFYPITRGGNYIYREDEIPSALIAVQKWLDWGGVDAEIASTAGSGLTFKIHLSDFLASEGKYRSEKGMLAPYGEKLMAAFADTAQAIRQAAATAPANERQIRVAFRKAKAIVKILSEGIEVDRDWGLYSSFTEAFPQMEKDLNLTWLEEKLFGFPSVKNSIHSRLKDALSKGGYDLKRAEPFWGDVELAIHRLGDI